jgi:hypothetical protein
LFQSSFHFAGRLSPLVNGLGSPIPSSGSILADYLISDVTNSCGIRVYVIAGGDVSGLSSVAGDL